MSDRKPAARGGQNKPRMSGANSVHMQDRNVLRRMERERRNQEVQPQETLYDRISPLFSEPYKTVKGDELSSRIQRMLGDFEDGHDVGNQDLWPAFPYNHSTQLPLVECPKPSGHNPESVPESSTPLSESLQAGESWDSSGLPVPLSPLQSSDSDNESGSTRQAEAPPFAPTLPLNLHSKPSVLNQKKPTAYVRPMDGQDQMNGDSPDLKTSSEFHEILLKNSSRANRPLLKLQTQCVDMVCDEAERVEDILKEMTSWPPLLTNIHTPSTTEPPMLPVSKEDTHGFPAHNSHDSSDRVQQKAQGGSSSSSDSESSSSDTNSENGSKPEEQPAPESTHTQEQKGSDWQLGRWLEIRENQQNPCDVTRPSSHDSSVRTEAKGHQGCYSNPTHCNTEADHTPTVVNTGTCESLQFQISQRNEDASTRREKRKRKKTDRQTDRTRSPDKSQTRQPSVSTKRKHRIHTHTQRPLLVKIRLELLSRIPQEDKRCSGAARRPAAHKHTSTSTVPSGLKRTAERDEKSERKKQKLEKEGKHSSSSQHTISQSEAFRSSSEVMKSRPTHRPAVPHEPQRDSKLKQKRAEAHGKKPSKSRSVKPPPMCPTAAKPRPLLPVHRRKLSVEDHMKEAKKLKHKADAMVDKMSKALSYLEAALSFVESGVAMETDPQTPKSAYTMFSETVDLIRFILKLKNYTDPPADAHDTDFLVLCLRCQSLLQMAMFRYKRDSALKYSRTLTDHFKSSSCSASPCMSKGVVSSAAGTVVIPQIIQQVATSYVNITTLVLSAHETWDQAEELAQRGSGLLLELDSVVGRLSLLSSMSSLLQYTRHGLFWIRLDTHNSL
ncbi:AF4/FMR2 family member 3 [Xyrauchen texanus]|uniref:AF4/FMR2 family member 3 n=1 Tax=Xyrauchen texanus TaxID=154827 RepID=UPI002242A0C6|nr:AF4/FMR2 family member 3 [Xyrauchen texanus]XP_051961762.1 AF4/FMR2 family member 3 [Xyrauchen texanus]